MGFEQHVQNISEPLGTFGHLEKNLVYRYNPKSKGCLLASCSYFESIPLFCASWTISYIHMSYVPLHSRCDHIHIAASCWSNVWFNAPLWSTISWFSYMFSHSIFPLCRASSLPSAAAMWMAVRRS